MMCTGILVVEFKDIIFKASRKTFELFQANFNKKICIADEISDKVKAWKFKKIEVEAGEARLPSNYLLIPFSAYRYTPSTGKGSSQKIGSLEYLGYSEPRCSILVKSTQTRMGI